MRVGPLRIEVTSSQLQWLDEVRAFADSALAPRAADIDRNERLPDDLVALMAEHGLLGSMVGHQYGGRSLDAVSYGLLHGELGRVCSSTRSLLTVHDMVAWSIQRLGGSALRAEWLSQLGSGRTIAAFALTEPDAGSDAGAITTTASRRGDHYALSGQKKWISFAQLADVFLVIARIGEPNGSIGGFLVPRNTAGLSITPVRGLLGLRGCMLGDLLLEDCSIPVGARVGSESMPAGLLAAIALQLGRLSVAWGCLGIIEACWRASSSRAEQRRQFGVPLAEHQLVQEMLTDMATDLMAARLLCLDAASAMEERSPRAAEAVLIAKYFASRRAAAAGATAVQLHGALGCSDALPVERYFRDARVMEIIEGSTQLQQIMIARHLRQRAPEGDSAPDRDVSR